MTRPKFAENYTFIALDTLVALRTGLFAWRHQSIATQVICYHVTMVLVTYRNIYIQRHGMD